MLKKILRGKVRERRGVRDKEIQEEKVYGRKGYRDVKGSKLEEGPGVGMLKRILGGKVRDKTGSTGK